MEQLQIHNVVLPPAHKNGSSETRIPDLMNHKPGSCGKSTLGLQYFLVRSVLALPHKLICVSRVRCGCSERENRRPELLNLIVEDLLDSFNVILMIWCDADDSLAAKYILVDPFSCWLKLVSF